MEPDCRMTALARVYQVGSDSKWRLSWSWVTSELLHVNVARMNKTNTQRQH